MSELDLIVSPRRTVMRGRWFLGERGISSSPRGTNGIAKPAASSSRRSSRSLRSLVIPNQTTAQVINTGMAAPIMVATTTRARSEGVRVSILDKKFMFSPSLHTQYESHAADGVQQPGAATGFQFAAQVADEYVDDVGVGGEVVAPDQFQQLGARQYCGLVFGQHGQQVEFALGQVDVDAVDPGPPARDVDLQRSDGDRFR